MLQPEIKRCEDASKKRRAASPQVVVLVTVDCDALLAAALPSVLFIDLDAKQVFHDIGDPGVVVSFDPNDFDVALGVGQLADVRDQLPVFAGQPGEIKVLENVTEKDQAFELGCFQEMRQRGRQRYCRAEMDVTDDECFGIHALTY